MKKPRMKLTLAQTRPVGNVGVMTPKRARRLGSVCVPQEPFDARFLFRPIAVTTTTTTTTTTSTTTTTLLPNGGEPVLCVG